MRVCVGGFYGNQLRYIAAQDETSENIKIGLKICVHFALLAGIKTNSVSGARSRAVYIGEREIFP